ncbi:MAG: bifunctional metallophosphatase/5'-nucleotidase [Candidatus Heimdallarchaeota archaeon]|nr:MAG: bifunctional metallophosphatase/5'-nucleotidase [Candidatus Heimdallarchaeota archaeon]
MNLRILYISDLHSRYEELAKIASAMEENRDKNTIVLDGGDNADFMRVETEGTNGRISSAILNKIGFTARVFGNNEGFAGIENGRIISENSECPVITCNMYDLEGKKLDFLEDSVIINVDNVRVLIIGVTAAYNVFYNLFGINTEDPHTEIARVLSDYDEDDYDFLVLLSHLGLNEDKAIALRMPTIDVIIGGHSHTTLEKPIVENHTIICQAGAFGESLGELVLNVNREKRAIQNFSGRLIPAKNYPPHPQITDLILHYSKIADEKLSRTLYQIGITLDHSLTDENAMGNLLADALIDILKTEIAIINSGVMNKGIEKGKITKKLLQEICPSPLNPTAIDVRGEDLLRTLEKSLLKDYQLMDGTGAGFRGKWLGNIQVSSNVQVHYNPDDKPLCKIKTVTINGDQLESQKWYSVGTSDYLQRGTGYKDLANSKNEKYRPEFLKDVLELYLKKPLFLEKALLKRFLPMEL